MEIRFDAEKDRMVQEAFPRSMYTPDNLQEAPYPISGFSWLVLKPLDGDSRKKALCDFLRFLPKWSEEKGQRYLYAIVPDYVATENLKRIGKLCSPK